MLNRKIVGIFVMTLLIATTFSVVGMSEKDKTNEKSRMHQVNCERMTSVFKDGNDDELDQQQTQDCSRGYGFYKNKWKAQGFTPSLKVLTRVKLHIFRHGDLPDSVEIFVSIRNSLTGDDLTYIAIDASGIYDRTWVEFDFPDISVIPNDKYYIICNAKDTGDSENYFCWIFDTNNPYGRGDAWYSSDSGQHWKVKDYPPDWPEIDFCFKTYGRGTNPYKPNTPSGPEEGDVGLEHTYYTSTTDPLDKQVYYMWDWGDGNYSEWFGPYSSGTTISSVHSWSAEGIYSVKVKAKNTEELESEWSNPIIVGIPVKK